MGIRDDGCSLTNDGRSETYAAKTFLKSADVIQIMALNYESATRQED